MKSYILSKAASFDILLDIEMLCGKKVNMSAMRLAKVFKHVFHNSDNVA